MKYTKEILEPLVINSTSVNQVLIKLNLKLSGGNHAHIKRCIKFHNIDTSHFKGYATNTGIVSPRRLSKEEFISKYLKASDENKSINTYSIKNKLFRYNLKNKICEVCKNTIWQNKEIPLELHHKDGNRWNNKLDNLMILCPNCHAQTNNYCSNNIVKRNKTKKTKKEISEIRSKAKYGLYRKVKRPDYETLVNEIKSTNYTAVGRKYNVSDNSVRKWVKMYEKHEK